MAARGALLGTIVLALSGIAEAQTAGSESERPAAVLQRQGIAPNVAGVLAFLRQQEPTQESLARIDALVQQLGDDSYDVRERATRELGTCGQTAVRHLQNAEKSNDAEVCYRARRLLLQWNRDGGSRQYEALLAAALQWLKESPTPQATSVLLRLLPHLPDAPSRQAAGEVIWACAAPANAEELRAALRHESLPVRAAAIPALELALGEDAVESVLPYLQDADESLRLAASRALLDRRPRPAVAALIGLLDSKDDCMKAEAGWLLQQVSNIPPGNSTLDLATASQQWRAWSSGAEKYVVVGSKRLQAKRFGNILTELFAEEAAEIQKTYRLLQYEASLPAKASVAQGVLRLHGDHAEGDQRLCAVAEKLLGNPTFPAAFRVKTALGGEASGAGAWHVGVSVGNVRVLFHPGLEGGGFRAERVDTHQFLLENQNMPFTPRGGVLYDMTIDVERQGDGSVRLDLTIADGGENGAKFTHELMLKGNDIGEFRRVGLERSGRTGGAALFRSFEILHRVSER